MPRLPMKLFKPVVLSALLLAASLVAAPSRAAPPPQNYLDLNYVNVMQALIKLGKFKPDNIEYLDAYSMVAHCDIVKGSFRDEFRWNQARDAVKKWIALKKPEFPTRLSVRSRIIFDRYDFNSKLFLFSQETHIEKLNSFNTSNRPADPDCDKPVARLLPSRYRVITNNPLTLPGLRLTQEQARDLAQKFNLQGNAKRMAYIRFNIDIVDADYMGPSVFTSQVRGDQPFKVKAALHSVEFFSDPEYRNRFYYYVPL